MGIVTGLVKKGVVIAAKSIATNAINDHIADKTNEIAETRELTQAQKDSGATIKNGRLYLPPTRSKYEYLHENALEIADELLEAGFENVTLTPIKKLNNGAINKYGQIHKITINGNKEFDKTKKLPSSAVIHIEYLDFKYTTPNTYKNVSYITPGPVQKVEPPIATTQTTNKPITPEPTSFCIYCGFPNQNSTFCGNCGKKSIENPSSHTVINTNQYCSNCGFAKKAENELFCTNCGNKHNVFSANYATAPISTNRFCSQCGFPKRNESESFCINCGNRI